MSKGVSKSNYQPEIWVSTPPGAGPYPEFASPRFNPKNHPIGVCFSGGGIRAFTAAVGQMRALSNIPGFMDKVGAVSSVSGGTWFNAMYQFADASIDDATLLGPMVKPENISASEVQALPKGFIGAWMPKATNSHLWSQVRKLEADAILGEITESRIWGRLIDRLLLHDYGISDIHKQFTQTPVAGVPSFTPRKNRPYFIDNATLVYPVTGTKQYLRHFEFTSIYSGTAQYWKGAGHNGADIGGGYVDSYAFATNAPTSTSPVTVEKPKFPFLLSDAMGASSAAPEAILDQYDFENVGFPIFDYWSPVDGGKGQTERYPFADGGSLENIGIVPLLRRQYKTILAFVNAETPIGSTDGSAVDGVAGQIARLFGILPKSRFGNSQDTQVFGADKAAGKAAFDTLAAALKKRAGTGAFYSDCYDITPNNSFDIPAYASGQVKVVWFHLNLNTNWKTALGKNPDKSIPAFLNSTNKYNNFADFPNFNTFGQNYDMRIFSHKFRAPFWLTPAQVTLLSNMTAYTVGVDAASELAGL